ncbi:MAG TPA: TonB-dependent receptor plug domain-containing protein [Terracidiphilus sp.]
MSLSRANSSGAWAVFASLLFVLTRVGVCPAEAPPQPVNNAQSLRNLTLEQLAGVEVTTYNKTPSELWNTPAALYVITGDQIRRSGVTNIADALRLAPGVEVGRVSSTTWAVGIRGLQNNFSKSVLVLIDGRNVYTQLFAGVYWDVQDMPVEDIDHIEVIRGPGGTIWGPNAANGVINIITRNSSDTHGIYADALAGTEDQTIDDLQVGGAAGSFDYRIYGRGFQRRHEYHSDGLNDDTWHQERLGFRADRSWKKQDFFLDASLYRGNSPHIVGATARYDEVSGGDINLRWDHNLSRDKGCYLQAYFERALRNRTAINEGRNTFDIDFIQHFRLGEKNLVSYGGTLHWSPWRTTPAGVFVPSKGTDHEHTGFLQDEIRLAHRVWLTAGTKVEHNNYSGFDLQPSARVLWSAGEEQAVWGGITHAVTTPSDLEDNFNLQGITPTLIVQVLGNRSFKSEGVTGYEAGYRRLLGSRVYASLSGFWNEYSRLQSFSAPDVTTSGGKTVITIQYQNQITGSAAGAELVTQTQLAPWWRFNANYSFVNSDFSANGPTSDISSSGSVRTYEGSSPKHQINVQSMFDLPAHIQFDQTYRFVSALAAQKVPAYQTMDMRLQKALGRNISLELVGQNLFQNRHYEWGTGDPSQPPIGIYRAGYIRLSFQTGEMAQK